MREAPQIGNYPCHYGKTHPDQARGELMDDVEELVNAVGPRLRALRQQRDVTLTGLSQSTGISVSTLSRLESGSRRPTLELLLSLAKAHQVPLEQLVGSTPTQDPRVPLHPIRDHGQTVVPLSRQPGGIRAYQHRIDAGPRTVDPKLRTHEGYEWLYVLSGRLRLRVGDLDLVLRRGEVAEFDTREPHWFGSADGRPVEMLSLFGPQGERMHVKVRPASRRTTS
jgi:transcriptional regulator with XRE-family HTH domain